MSSLTDSHEALKSRHFNLRAERNNLIAKNKKLKQQLDGARATLKQCNGDDEDGYKSYISGLEDEIKQLIDINSGLANACASLESKGFTPPPTARGFSDGAVLATAVFFTIAGLCFGLIMGVL